MKGFLVKEASVWKQKGHLKLQLETGSMSKYGGYPRLILFLPDK